MATHSSVLAWRIPGTGEPGGLPSMGSHRVGHDWSDLAAAVAVAVNPKGNQPWTLVGKTNADTEAPVLWPADVKTQFTGKDPNAGKDWRQKEKRVAEAEMVGWHHRFNGHELGQTSADSEGQGGLACCSPWGHKRVKHDWATEQQHIHLILYIISFRLPW